jgi:deazaflavin-dependent oxidoreductase (nitroreductase family)
MFKSLLVALKRRQAYPSAASGVKESETACLPLKPRPILTPMNLKEGSSVVAHLTTIGRKTGQPRTVELRFVYYRGRFYASSSRVQGKHWCQNMLKNPAVEMKVKGETIACIATRVTDDDLRKEILTSRASPRDMDRVVFEIKPRS